jgi:hypothetical protein
VEFDNYIFFGCCLEAAGIRDVPKPIGRHVDDKRKAGLFSGPFNGAATYTKSQRNNGQQKSCVDASAA